MTNNKTTALIEAAKAVVDRWDSPNWGGRNLAHTSDYINRLRDALSAFDKPQPNATALIAEQKTCKAMTKAKRGFYGHVPSHQCTKLAVIGDYCKKHAGIEALAAFEQQDQYKQQVIGQATITIPRQEYESLKREQQQTSDVCIHPLGQCKQTVRELSVEEVADIIDKCGSAESEHDAWQVDAIKAAKALAKLGTIRVVEG